MHKPNEQKSSELCPPSLLDVTPLCWDFKLHRSLGFEPAVHPNSSSRHSSLGPWAPSIPQKHNELISVGTFETSWSAPAWLSTNPSQGPLSRPEASWPWWVPQTAFSCHLAAWEAREGQSHQGRPQVSGKVEKATTTLMHRNQEVSK